MLKLGIVTKEVDAAAVPAHTCTGRLAIEREAVQHELALKTWGSGDSKRNSNVAIAE